MMKNILFVLTDALNEELNDKIEREIDDLGIGRPNVKFCGVEISSDEVLSVELVKWADIIITIEKWHRDELFRQIPESLTKDVRLLDILEEDLSEHGLLKRVLSRIFN